MKPQDDYRNGDGGGSGGVGSVGSRAGSASGSDDSEGSEGEDNDLALNDPTAPARALAALNALRKSRQHFDCVLVADGVEVAAHRAVLAAASPYLLEALSSSPPPTVGTPVLDLSGASATALRVEGVDAEALRALVEYAYTGRARGGDAAGARRLYRAAWRLRVEAVRAQLAERLARRVAPADCVELRALPDLEPHLQRELDNYIAQNFEEICSSGALAALPQVHMEMLRESSAEHGGEKAVAVADAALAWLRDRLAKEVELEELCSRTHLLYVDAAGSLRDCGELPRARDEAPSVGEYRRETSSRRRERAAKDAARPPPKLDLQLGARVPRTNSDCTVIAARLGPGGATRALVTLHGRLAWARVAWRAAGGRVARGGVLGGVAGGGERLGALGLPRCAHGTHGAQGRIVAVGGYDRARVLRAAEAYDPLTNAWSPLADMRVPRARFPVAGLGGALYVLGGSDGHADLDSVDALENGVWKQRTRLPLARTHAAAAADAARARLYVVGGWAGGLSLRRVDVYAPETDTWDQGPTLNIGRSQCVGVVWEDALWVLGGCDAWHCLASTETLPLGEPAAAWSEGPPLPTARRSVGGAVWRGALVSAGGSDGAASLRRTDWLPRGCDAWRPLPALRTPRAGAGLTVLGRALYAVGGFDGKEFLGCMETLRDPEGEWTTLWQKPVLTRLSISVTEPAEVTQEEVKENGTSSPGE